MIDVVETVETEPRRLSTSELSRQTKVLSEEFADRIAAHADGSGMDFSTRTELAAIVAARIVANHVAADSITRNMLDEQARETTLDRHLEAFAGVTRKLAREQFDLMSASLPREAGPGSPKH